ncbi:hypothetical protein F8M41_020802 [Gigaspora margarita]|uniref:Uncharacterized protein n=1 Tax=Gigaspora margarita TaxID=4874 RepID=A0A8H4AHV3_GIGMA|nr:hypothetical protein F8M41_020802 [Gigaspora margarita]
MNLKPIPWHVQNLILLRPLPNPVVQRVMSQRLEAMPLQKEYEVNATKKKISFSNTKSSKKHKSARPRSERSLLHNKTSSKKSSNTSSDKKSSKDIRLLKILTDNIILNAFITILQSMVDLFTRTQPKEVSINGYNMINAEFIVLKEPVLNHFTSNFSDKEREKFWHEITMVFSHIL